MDYDPALSPGPAAAVMGIVTIGFIWAGARGGSNAYRAAAGLALLSAAAMLTSFVAGDTHDSQALVVFVEAAVVLGLAVGIELARRRRQGRERAADPSG
jgi:hypothetical protein